MGEQVRLKLLLGQRHWTSYRTFTTEYDRAARAVDPKLIGKGPSRAQLHRWMSGELQHLPYGDHRRVLEKMLPGHTVQALFELVDDQADVEVDGRQTHLPGPRGSTDASGVRLITSGVELVEALASVLHDTHRCLIAVGSRSREPAYLTEIERVVAERPHLTHYRILIGGPHSQVFKDHLLRLARLRDTGVVEPDRLRIGIQTDTTTHHERFFVAGDRSAVVLLPSAQCHSNFDTGLLVHDQAYVQGLLAHGQALYGKHRLDTAESIDQLEVLE